MKYPWLLKCGIVVLTILCSAPLHAEETSGSYRLSLGDALRMARTRPVTVLVAHERVQQAIARLGQERSAFFPQVSGSASQIRQTRNLEAFGIEIPGRDPLVGPFNTFDARVALTQNIFDASAIARLKAARRGQLLSLKTAYKTEQDAMALVALLFIEAKRAQEKIGLAESALQESQAHWRLAKTRQDIGSGSSYDVKRAASKFEEARHALMTARANATERHLDLMAILRLDESRPIVFVDMPAKRRQQIPSKQEVRSSLKNHPDIHLAEQGVQFQKAKRSVQKSLFLPRLSALADYGASGTDPSQSEGTYSFGVAMEFPLFLGGSRFQGVKEASSRVKEAEARLTDTEYEREAKALSAREMLLEAQGGLRAARAKRDEAAMQFKLAKHRLDTGLGDELELIDAGLFNSQAEDQWRDAQATYQIAEINLAHAMGRMQSFAEETP